MNLVDNRKWITEHSIIGELSADYLPPIFILENRKLAIPTGTYEVQIVASPRFTWRLHQPDCPQWIKDRKRADGNVYMPQLQNVPKRSGIEIHVANEPDELEGCLAPGLMHSTDFVGHSVTAFDALFAKIEFALASGELVTIAIKGDLK